MFFVSQKKNIVGFLNSFVSKKIHISYFFPVSKVINKIFRFCRYIWRTFSFFINKNPKIKTQIYNFSLMIKNERIITLFKNFFTSLSITVEKQENDVKKEMENEKEIDWQHLHQNWFGNVSTLSCFGAKILSSYSV